jgi:putative AlgH/UPF0301 family transcriptional regulator
MAALLVAPPYTSMPMLRPRAASFLLARAEVPDEDWRQIRAQLVQGEQGLERKTAFAYESPLIERGTVLLDMEMGRKTEIFGYPSMHAPEQIFFHKAVLLVTERSQDGSTSAIILNRKSALQLDGWLLHFGGPCGAGGLFGVGYDVAESGRLVRLSSDREQPDTRQLICLHSQLELSQVVESLSRPLLPGLWATSLEGATQLVAAGAKKSDFYAAVGCARWRPGQLEAEVDRGSWARACVDAGTLLDAVSPGTPAPTDCMRAGADVPMEALNGLSAWEDLMRVLGRSEGATLQRGTQSDGMLAEWVRTRMLAPRPAE